MHISVQIAPEAASLLHRHFASRGAPPHSSSTSRAQPAGDPGDRAGDRKGGPQRRRSRRRAGGGLPADLAALATVIRPVHEGIDDEILKTFFMAEVADADAAARLIEQLRRSPHVLAAYAKPADDMP
jgi:hypothetical protein